MTWKDLNNIWGQTVSFSDLIKVSNFNWRCQLSNEVLFFLGWDENWRIQRLLFISAVHWALLDTPRQLNWPKSPPFRVNSSDFALVYQTLHLFINFALIYVHFYNWRFLCVHIFDNNAVFQTLHCWINILTYIVHRGPVEGLKIWGCMN